jgi:hypothetical protein
MNRRYTGLPTTIDVRGSPTDGASKGRAGKDPRCNLMTWRVLATFRVYCEWGNTPQVQRGPQQLLIQLEWRKLRAFLVLHHRTSQAGSIPMITKVPFKIKSQLILLTAMTTGGVAPVLADCCDSVWSCAATVVTYGVSCEIETIIQTVQGLITVITNLVDVTTGQTNQAVQAARNNVTMNHDFIQSNSQQFVSNLSAAMSQAQAISENEKHFKDFAEKTLAGNHDQLQSTTSTGSSKTASRQMAVQPRASEPTAPPPASSGSGLDQTAIASQNMVTLQSTLPPPGSFSETFSIATKQIASLQSQGQSDMAVVNQNLVNAMNSEGKGELSAADIANKAINAPLESLRSWLSGLLSDPTKIFDPSSQVQTVEDSVMGSLETNVSTMIDDVVDAPNNYFEALGPSFAQLQVNELNAQAIAAAMDKMYKQRTPATIAALDALLPKQSITQYASLSKASVQATLNIKSANGTSFADAAAHLKATKLQVIASIAPRIQEFHMVAAKLKAQVAQRKLAQTPSMLQTYQGNLNQKLGTLFDGKPASAVIAQRDQLISQARTQFAKDPKTENAVIALFNSEAAKRTGIAAKTAPAPAAAATATAYSQPVASATAPLARQVTAVAQPTNVVPSVAPVSQPQATAWATAPPAWKPPVSATVAAAPPAAATTSLVKPLVSTTPAAFQPVAVPATGLPVIKPVQPVKPNVQVAPIMHVTPAVPANP